MTIRARLAALACLAVLFASPAVMATEYRQEAGSTLVFASKYDGEVFTGRFPGFSTTLSFDPAVPQDAQLDVVIPLADVDTGSAERDGMLRDAAFFAVARFPEARYTATGFTPDGDGRYIAEGTLELKGIQAPVTLRISWTPGEQPVLEARALVPRTRFTVGTGDWSDTAMIPDAVAINARVVFSPCVNCR